MFFFIISILLVQNDFIEIKSQLILNSAQYQTNCSDGLRSGIDVFSLTGSVGPDFSNLVKNSRWQDTIYATIQRKGSGDYKNLCPIPIGVNGSSCIHVSTSTCYCSDFDFTKQTAYFIVNYTALAINGNATIHLEWQNANRTIIYSNSQTISKIYDSPKLELTVQSNTTKITNAQILENDIIEVAFNENFMLEFTCSETATPCYVNIYSNGTLSSGTQSVRVSVTYDMVIRSGKLNITTEYAMCSKELLKRNMTFFLQADKGSSTVTSTISTSLASESSTVVIPPSSSKTTIPADESSTAVTSTSSPKTPVSATEQTAPNNNQDLKIGLGVGLSLGLLIVIGIIVAGIIYFKKKRRNAAKLSSEQQLTKQNAADNSSNDDGNKRSSTENGANKMGTDENKSNKAEINKPANSIQHTKDTQEHEGKEEVSKDTNINGNIYSNSQSRPLPSIKGSVPTRPVSIEETRGNLNNPK